MLNDLLFIKLLMDCHCVNTIFSFSRAMPVDDELTTPMLQSDDEERANRNRLYADDELGRQVSGCGASACCNPSSMLHRFIALILMCLVGFGMASLVNDNLMKLL